MIGGEEVREVITVGGVGFTPGQRGFPEIESQPRWPGRQGIQCNLV